MCAIFQRTNDCGLFFEVYNNRQFSITPIASMTARSLLERVSSVNLAFDLSLVTFYHFIYASCLSCLEVCPNESLSKSDDRNLRLHLSEKKYLHSRSMLMCKIELDHCVRHICRALALSELQPKWKRL